MRDSRFFLLALLLPALLLGCPTTRVDDDDDASDDDDDAAATGDWDSSSIDPLPLGIWLGAVTEVSPDDLDDFDIVVLGEQASPGGAGFVELVTALDNRGVQVYAWLDAGSPRAPAEIDGVLAWYGSLPLYGVTLDRLGLEVTGNNEARPILFANTARGHGLSVMMTAPTPSDVMGELDGLGQAVTTGDRFLLQDFVWQEGVYQDEDEWRALVDEAMTAASNYGATVIASLGGDQTAESWTYAFHAAWLDGLEALSQNSPASDDIWTAPVFPGPADGGSAFTSEVTVEGSIYSRTTDTGTLAVDAENHTVTFEIQ
jgi:hypothetical protein